MADKTIRFVFEGDNAPGGLPGAGPQATPAAAGASQERQDSLVTKIAKSAVILTAAQAIAKGVGGQIVESTSKAISDIFKKAAAEVEEARASGQRKSFLAIAFEDAKRRVGGQVAGAGGLAGNVLGDVSGSVGKAAGMGLDALEKRLPDIGAVLGKNAADSLTDSLSSFRAALEESGGLMGAAGSAATEAALESLRNADVGGMLADAIYQGSLDASQVIQRGFGKAWSELKDVLRMVPGDIEAIASARDRALVSMSSAEQGLNRVSWPTRGEPERGLSPTGGDAPLDLDREELESRRSEELAESVRADRAAREAARALAERTRELAAARDRERYRSAEPDIAFDNIDEVVSGERERRREERAARPRRPRPDRVPPRPRRPAEAAAEATITPEIVPEVAPAAPGRGAGWLAAISDAMRRGISGAVDAAKGVGRGAGGFGSGVVDRARELFNTPGEINRLVRGSLPFRAAAGLGNAMGFGAPGSMTAAAAGLGAVYVAAKALSFGFGLLTTAVKGAWDALVWMDRKVMEYAGKIGDFSPDIAAQRAGETVRTIQRRQQWAREDGPQVAAWMRSNEQFNVFFERIDRALVQIILDFGTLLDYVGRAANIVTQNPKLLKDMVYDALAFLFGGPAMAPFYIVAKRIMEFIDWWRGKEAQAAGASGPLEALRRWGPMPVKYNDIVYNPGGLPDLDLEGQQARGTVPGMTGDRLFNIHREFW